MTQLLVLDLVRHARLSDSTKSILREKNSCFTRLQQSLHHANATMSLDDHVIEILDDDDNDNDTGLQSQSHLHTRQWSRPLSRFSSPLSYVLITYSLQITNAQHLEI